MLKSTDVNDEIVCQNQRILQDLNTSRHSRTEVRQLVGEITGKEIDESIEIRLPFYTDFGRNIKLGKNIFINSNVMLTDLGGIELEDNVLIGPNTTIVSVNHVENPSYRKDLELRPVLIKKNAWLGANVTVLPGVTIGENVIVGAGTIVTKDVPDNTMVVGNPAREIRKIKENLND